jgi:tungstate transport system substrate-binding protein
MRQLKVLLMGFLMLLLSTTAATEERIRLATTTSTDNSGLLAVVLPPFEQKYDMKVDVIAVGTGKALKLGENGDVDVVLVHSRADEDAFVEKGFGVNRRDVMYNDFIVVGPASDPAGIKGSADASAALKLIAANEAPFVSRGDNSGTHQKEKELWEAAGIKPQGQWHVEAGQGMGAVLQMADEKRGYTLVDRGTWLAYSDKLELAVLLEGDPRLFNPYGIIAVNPVLHPHVKYMQAMLLIAWFTSPEGQRLIGDFKIGGQSLFIPVAVPTDTPKK